MTESAPRPGFADILILYGVTLLYTFALGSFFARLSPFWGLSIFTLGIGLLPLGYSYARGFVLTVSFPLRKPEPKELSGVFLMTAGLLLLALAATGLLMLFLPSGIPGAEDTAAALTGMNDWAAVVAVGLLPALCEEVLFRGFILSALRHMTGKWRAIAITALLFGILHRDPARIPLTAGVGIALGYVAWETRSIVLSAVMHAAYNLSLFFLARMAGAARDLADSGGLQNGAAASGGGLTALAGGSGLSALQIVSALMPLVPFTVFGVLLLRKGAARLKSAQSSSSNGFQPPEAGAREPAGLDTKPDSFP